jgi:hypothetical protein
MSAPTPHQLLLALSKVRLNPAQVRVLAYLAAFTVPAPRSEILEHWVVGAGARTIAHESGLTYRAVLHALWGDKRADRSGQRGLVELGVIRCWSRGGGAGEAVFSVNGNFEEWAVEWAPTTRTNRPATLREVLFELKSAFAAPGKGVLAAPPGAALDDVGAAPQGQAPPTPIDARAPSSWETSSPASRASSSSGHQQPHETPPAAAEILDELRTLTKRKLWGDPFDEVVHAVCDNNVAHAGSFGPNRWKAAVDLAVQLLAAGPPNAARRGCEECGGRGIVFDEEADVARPCPACRPDAA